MRAGVAETDVATTGLDAVEVGVHVGLVPELVQSLPRPLKVAVPVGLAASVTGVPLSRLPVQVLGFPIVVEIPLALLVTPLGLGA